VPEIVRAGTQPPPVAFQAGLADQRWEGSVERDARQPPAAFAEEKSWRDGFRPAQSRSLVYSRSATIVV
jgi:hypothetical protein